MCAEGVSRLGDSVKALIIADGRVPPRSVLPEDLFGDVDLVVAADGGAERAAALGLRPDLVVGDGDSIDPDALGALAASGTAVERYPAEKDESDLELALKAAMVRGADEIVILGALGGARFEHEMAAVALLGLEEASGRDVTIADDRSTVRLLRGSERAGVVASLDVRGAPGDFVSILPWGGDATGVATEGLRYALRDEVLRMGPSRGLSNELTVPTGRISCRRGQLLVVHTRRSALLPASSGNLIAPEGSHAS